ncbi:hypothetical protein CRG98_028192 [Punica granatum]|uniref:Uncharacterized protein n=1 Tax=Punica granatum TaxID=22663 RepID=A0A2I0J6R5_PUNGR|nr:hypothetical protein CRG98_028192 [Punica granatum]
MCLMKPRLAIKLLLLNVIRIRSGRRMSLHKLLRLLVMVLLGKLDYSKPVEHLSEIRKWNYDGLRQALRDLDYIRETGHLYY